jgi:hypothetical protein
MGFQKERGIQYQQPRGRILSQQNSAMMDGNPKTPLDLGIQVSTLTTTLSDRVHSTTPM